MGLFKLDNPVIDKKHTYDTKIVELIRRRRLQIMIHSIIYYNMNTNIISDNKWSKWAFELVSLQEKYPKESLIAVYHKEFKGFDGSTGFDIAQNADDWAIGTAQDLVKYNNGEIKE
jgi:hypothetical protein